MAAPKGNCYNPNGPPQKEIKWSQFKELCSMMCTQEEICNVLEISDETLRNRVKEEYGEDYLTVYKKFSSIGKISLRRKQFDLAQKNVAMAIWLGKQWLGQKETSSESAVAEETSLKFIELMSQFMLLQSQKKCEKGMPSSTCDSPPCHA